MTNPSPKPIKDYERDNYINNQKGLSNNQKEFLKNISNQVWFKQYSKESKEALKKITAKVKKGIKKNKYHEYYENRDKAKDRRGVFEPPTKKPKKAGKKNPKIAGKKNPKVKLTPKQKEKNRKEYRKAYNQRPDVKEKNRERKRKKK